MQYKPHPYQTVATKTITETARCVMLLEMGLGKTIITLTAIKNLLDTGTIRNVLIIAPLRVAQDTWPLELTKWDHLTGIDYAVAVGTRQQRENALDAQATVTIINRENVPWLIDQYPTTHACPFDMIVIDELSSFKNHQAKRFRALKPWAKTAKRVVGLTGTPAPNGLLDLWAQYKLIDDGWRLGSYITHYREKYFDPDQYGAMQVYSWKPKPGAEEKIYDRISDITLSMRTRDHLELPALTEVNRPVRLPRAALDRYRLLKREMILDLEGEEVTAANAASLALKLTQMTSGAVYGEDGTVIEIHDAKLDALEEAIEAANGQPLMVAYWFKHDYVRIKARFPQAIALDTPAAFQAWNEGRIPIGLIHPASAGHGLNLQAGGHLIVWFSLTWSLELYQQLNARLHRQGQENPVTVARLVVPGSIDERVVAALEGKSMTQDGLIEAVKTELCQVV